MQKRIEVPFSAKTARTLHAGESVLLSGIIYTARDAAHKRLCALLAEGKPLPFDIKNSTIYYVGPTPAREDGVIGSAGPTTSYRMDAYSPMLIAAGETGMIGKGKRGAEVINAMHEHGAVYFGAVGGAGALLSHCIKSAEVIAYEDLGAEAVRKLVIEDFPVTVVIDSYGENIYESGRREFLQSISGEKIHK